MPVFFGAAGVAAALVAARRTRWWPVWAVLAGWAFAAGTSSLYLPWIVPIALLLAVILFTALHRDDWRTWLPPVAVAGGVAVVVILQFLLRHRAGLQAAADTVYPGDRAGRGGELRLERLLSAPFDVFASGRTLTDFYGVSPSETASGFMWWIPIVMLGGVFAPLRSWRSASPIRRQLAAVGIVSVTFAAWATLPLPGIVGTITLLDNTHSSRLAWPLTVASAVLAALYLVALRSGDLPRPSTDRAITAIVVFVALTAWSGGNAVRGAERADAATLLLLVGLTALATVLLVRGAWAGALVAVLVMGWSSVRVNPVQVGLDPITEAPLTAQIEPVAADDPAAVWVANSLDDVPAASLLVASGAPTLDGLSWYPDPSAWRTLDPDGAATDTWNRLANLYFYVVSDTPAPTIELVGTDVIEVTIDPCDPALDALGVRFIVSNTPLSATCLQLVDPGGGPEQRTIYARTG
jgi:hypothetical protein